MKALIVDDEFLARRELRRLLAVHDWVQVVGEAGHVEEAVEQIDRLSPDLLFLDIQMPGGSGFDLLDRLEAAPRVIFTTAYDQHAVRAFEVNALDYLLKPIEPERLAAALERARTSGRGAVPAHPAAPQDALERLFVRDGERCWFVPVREVRLLSAEGNYVRLHWGGGQALLGRTLNSLERRLDPRRFFRINRSQIVNLDCIESVALGIHGGLIVQLPGGLELEVSRRQARLFREISSP
jgi:two-component system LytT family response regulator